MSQKVPQYRIVYTSNRALEQLQDQIAVPAGFFDNPIGSRLPVVVDAMGRPEPSLISFMLD
ncbi:MAG: hypothetical protein WAW85_00100, partial [Gordonia sp. (in: high G+C Gram-positive bacteria)]|uniref:hypothetical protein n=1 Tax=Gordonia sp. (in: high G+C Gram-positive bacteria) TaxID=84139 RepID=UPI003BB74582